MLVNNIHPTSFYSADGNTISLLTELQIYICIGLYKIIVSKTDIRNVTRF